MQTLFMKNSLVNGATTLQAPSPLPSDTANGNSSLHWYSCGPTVYDSAHIGHARTYINTDIIRRIITDYFQYNVVFAMGITDIDDKIINKATEQGLYDWKGCESIVRPLEEEFFADLDALYVQRPHAVLRVSEHVEEIIAYIQKIIESGKAYVTSDGVYFDVESHGDSYGKLGIGGKKNSTEEMTESEQQEWLAAGREVTETNQNDKRSSKDFALWKFSKSTKEPSWGSDKDLASGQEYDVEEGEEGRRG